MANPVKKYQLTEEEKKKYDQLKPPPSIKNIMTTAPQQRKGKSGRSK